MSKVQTIVQELETLTLIEAAELVKEIEEKFGVSAQAVAAAPVAAAAGGDAGASAAEEKTEFNVKVNAVDASKKIPVLKVVKNIMGIGLGEAKAKLEEVPFVVKENVPKEEAQAMQKELAEAGAEVVLE